jgi:CTP synthase
VRQKIAMFSNVPMRRVFSMHDRPSIHLIPESMREAGLDREILTMLDLHERVDQGHEDRARARWLCFVNRLTAPRRFTARLGITGKYTALRDAYASIEKSIEHAAAHLAVDLDTRWIDTTEMATAADAVRRLGDLDAVIVPGGFGARGTEGKIACIEQCRSHRIPFLGICLGFQMAVIEFARHVCGLAAAASTEFDRKTPHPVIDILPEQKKIEGLGGNMRLGGKDVLISTDTLAAHLLGPDGDPGHHFTVRRRFRHRYEVDPRYVERLESHGLVFSGRHPHHPIMQILELPCAVHPFFIGAQFHPELTSRPLNPSPLFLGLIAAAVQHAHPHLSREQISTRWLPPVPAGSPR